MVVDRRPSGDGAWGGQYMVVVVEKRDGQKGTVNGPVGTGSGLEGSVVRPNADMCRASRTGNRADSRRERARDWQKSNHHGVGPREQVE